MEVNHLNPKLRDRYRIKNTHVPRVLQTPVGDIHFGTLTEEQADKLCSLDFYYLERITDAEQPKAESEKPKVKTLPADEQADEIKIEGEPELTE